MTPEELRLMRAYLEVMMGGGDPGLAMQFGPAPGKSASTNDFQDRMQILGDPLASSMGGLGAYDISAFEPTLKRNSVEAPGLRALQRWEDSGPDTIRGKMLKLILGDDKYTPEEAYGALLQTVVANPKGPLALTLPPVMGRDGSISSDPTAGLFSIYEEYKGIESAMASDPAGVQRDYQTGGYYTEEMVPSELATKWRDEYMLPLPTESYMDAHARVDGRPVQESVLEGEAMARQMAALGDREVTRRAASPYPQFGDAGILAQQAIDRLKTSDQKAGDRWVGTGSGAGSLGISPVEQERLDVRERDAGEVELPETMKTNIASLRDPELDAWQRSTGIQIGYDPIRRQTLNAYAGNRGTPRSYEPISRRSSPVNQERRDLQAQINQGVRDRFKENSSSTFADQVADDFYLSAGLTKAGRTPMTDAMRKRMAMQQLAGF